MRSLLTRTKLIVSGSLLVVPMLSGTVAAAPQFAQTTTPPSASTTPSPTPTPSPVTPTPATPTTPTAGAQERIAKRIADLKVKLTAAEQTRLKARCQGAQTVAKVLEDRATKVIANRTKVYEAIGKNLTTLSSRLSQQGIDVSTLTEQQATLKKMAEKLKADAEAYQQVLNDLNTLDCVKDPAGFKASLEEARTLRNSLAKQSAELRAYARDTLGGTLAQIKQQINAKKAEQ